VPAREYDVEIIDLDADELGEFDALAVCRDPTPTAEDDEEFLAEDQEKKVAVTEEE
jgi:hypothetical protein